VIRAAALLLATLLAAPAVAFDRVGVVAVADPPGGPDADLAELAHQLRAACRDRIGGVEDVPTMRARLLGQTSNATLSELDRAYGGALAVYQNGEFESALRTLHAIVEDLESLPETEDAYAQWVRAQLRLAHAALTIARDEEADEAFFTLAKTDGTLAPDPDQYSPSYRRRFEGVKAKVRALQARRLTVTSEGRHGTVFVNGRAMGTTPLALWLPSGTYRIGGAAEDLRVPGFRIDLRAEDRSVVLDFALAEALRVNAGPGLALPHSRRGDGIVRAGAWLGVDRVIAVSRVLEGQAAFLLGSFYDVRRGALLREGSVRMVAGSVPAASIGALAAFLLTGQSSREVKDRTEPTSARPIAAAAAASEARAASSPEVGPPPPTAAPAAGRTAAPPASSTAGAGTGTAAAAQRPAALAAPAASRAADEVGGAAPPPAVASRTGAPSLAVAPPREDREVQPEALADRADPDRTPPRWMRPTAIGLGVVAGGFAALAIQQGVAAHGAYSDADAMVGPAGALLPQSDPARYYALQEEGDAARRNAYLSAGAAAAFAVAAGYLGWRSADRGAEPAVAFRF
jgi:hypothetical protein